MKDDYISRKDLRNKYIPILMELKERRKNARKEKNENELKNIEEQINLFYQLCNISKNITPKFNKKNVLDALYNNTFYTNETYDEEGYSNNDSEEVIEIDLVMDIIDEGGLTDKYQHLRIR